MLDAEVDPSIVDVQAFLAENWPDVPNHTRGNQSLIGVEKARQLFGYKPQLGGHVLALIARSGVKRSGRQHRRADPQRGSARLGPTLDHVAAQRPPAGPRWEVIWSTTPRRDGTAEAALSRWPSNSPAEARVVRENGSASPTPGRAGFAEARGHSSPGRGRQLDRAGLAGAGVVEVMGESEVGACGGFNEPVLDMPPRWLERFRSPSRLRGRGTRAEETSRVRGFLVRRPDGAERGLGSPGRSGCSLLLSRSAGGRRLHLGR